jgi:acetylornithine deacetylase/succinyl-diaminopimelate desuccinylase-like protein
VRLWLGIGALVGAAAWAGRAEAPVALPSHPELAAFDPDVAEEEAVRLLSAYLAVPTVNPPGNERLGADFLAAKLAEDGIEATIYDLGDGRANLVARLEGATDDPPLCLLSHIDVVTAEAERWSHPPFSGELDADGNLWGRGALDMKSVGVIQLLSMVWLKRLGVPLQRDVVLLAVADEEVDNGGIRWLTENVWDELRCGHLLNEGGFGAQDVMFDGLTLFTVSFAEKGALWLRLVAEGEPGHGSTPLPDTAPLRLLGALDVLRKWEDKPTWHPELFRLMHDIGEKVGGLEGAVLKSPSATRTLATGRLMANPLSAAILTNTLNITGFGGAESPNVVPGRVWAQLDVRVLPGVAWEDVLAELRAEVADLEGVSIEVISGQNGEQSPTDDPVFEAITGRLREAFPEAAVGPFIMMGSTDSAVVRPLGVHAYGIAPFVLKEADLRGMHGDDEHIHRDNLGRGLEVMVRIVADAAGG